LNKLKQRPGIIIVYNEASYSGLTKFANEIVSEEYLTDMLVEI
jgi:hypothetical protein